MELAVAEGVVYPHGVEGVERELGEEEVVEGAGGEEVVADEEVVACVGGQEVVVGVADEAGVADVGEEAHFPAFLEALVAVVACLVSSYAYQVGAVQEVACQACVAFLEIAASAPACVVTSVDSCFASSVASFGGSCCAFAASLLDSFPGTSYQASCCC